MSVCKFCGDKLNGRGEWSACPKCGRYCMDKCPIASSGVTWHKEPCISCKHNPYWLRHMWDGKKWEVQDDGLGL
jgi:hypothetical protein